MNKTDSMITNQTRSREVELSLLEDFLANRISAAGVPHVIKSPSRLKRTLWTVVLVITAILMIVMSYRVFQEYLEYPTTIRSQQKMVSDLEFPAITVCSMIPFLQTTEGTDEFSKEVISILKTLPKYNFSKKDRTRCLKDPFCYWNWYTDDCKCEKNPCKTMHCRKNISDDKCECFDEICTWVEDTKYSSACYERRDQTGYRCFCNPNYTYPLANIDGSLEMENVTCDESYKECGPEFEGIPDNFWETLHMVNATDWGRFFWATVKATTDHEVLISKVFHNPYVYRDFTMDKIILSCDFAGHNCSNFQSLYTGTNGDCYTFNYVGEEAVKHEKVEKVKIPGKKHGVTLFMRSSSKDFQPFYAQELGARIIIHDPRSLPSVEENEIYLRQGDMTIISMEYKETHRLRPPWGECGQDGQKLGSYRQDPYKQNDCQRECVNTEIRERCGCFSRNFLRPKLNPSDGDICLLSEAACVKRVTAISNLNEIQLKCNCPPACREKQYQLSLSSSKLNKEHFKFIKLARSLRLVNGKPAVLRTTQDFESSILGVKIYYNTMITTHFNETPLYSWETLVANIGGNMGLFLGISLVTFFEIFEFLVDTIRNFFGKKNEQRDIDTQIHRSSARDVIATLNIE